MYYLLCSDKLLDISVMPVIKTTEYPASEFGTGPLCYLRLAHVSGLGVVVDLMCFERDPVLTDDPKAGSYTAAAFNFAPEKGCAPIYLLFGSDGKGGIYGEDGILQRQLPASTYAGADEQGWYWGVRFYLSKELLQQRFGIDAIRPGQRFLGAAYKVLEGEGGHFGAIAPVKELSVFSPENLAEFAAIQY